MKQAVIAAVVLCAGFASAQSKAPNPTGTYRGESVCLARKETCHDEKIIMHVERATKGKPDEYTVQADKIVNGRPENMGVLDCRFESVGWQLRCAMPQGTFLYKVTPTSLDGILTLPDGTALRHITVKRER